MDDPELIQYMAFLKLGSGKKNGASGMAIRAEGMEEQIRTTPIFTWQVKKAAELAGIDLPQYALLGRERDIEYPDIIGTTKNGWDQNGDVESSHKDNSENNTPKGSDSEGEFNVANQSSRGKEVPQIERPIFLNTNAPWSAFICGSQGSGKSHTLSCMLEACMLPDKRIGKLANPLAGIIFHYENHSSQNICEAATLCTTGIRVRVLVSRTHYRTLKPAYRSIPGGENIEILPLCFKQRDLNVQRMLRLMAFNSKEGNVPLYMEVVFRILRDMALNSKPREGFDYALLKQMLTMENLNNGQSVPLNMRLSLLDSYMDMVKPLRGQSQKSLFEAEPGTLTIVDLTDPLVDVAAACSLFDVCLGLFLERTQVGGKVVALDEAHKFLTATDAAEDFTNTLLTCIREQRHQAVRVIVSTQEPTISPKLLDLCSISVVHRFNSPDWLVTLRSHLAGASSLAATTGTSEQERLRKLFEEIVDLDTGEALLFAPSGMVDAGGEIFRKLGTEILKFKTRVRISGDGGRSKLAIREG